MTPIYLRSETEAAMIAGLPAYMRSTDEQGNPIWAVAGQIPRFDLCIIGPIVTTPAVIDPETGEEITPAVIDDRFHVNLMVDDEALTDIPESLIVDPVPATPAVKFAGVE
ncbi:hypothetical protein [Thalassospira aquimaris]|uniref:Uncharacterized protein n=1 Tax=Thalassospira aquimaris TaxID=3037796 RepID=A0ABT6GHL6_9PROT|nr:hypothetical protein [Thalassospira sp. FZY0004]MDG4721582.1 hypothetical protein [Thalassospira sp. FZY0004]